MKIEGVIKNGQSTETGNNGLISYLRYLSLLTYSGVQHISCCVFVVFVFVLCPVSCVPIVASFYMSTVYNAYYCKKSLKLPQG
jgi:hypothetical protein